MSHKPIEVVVLNVIQATALDSVLSGGKHNINDGSNDLSTPIRLSDADSYTVTAYSAGVLSDKEYDYAAVPLVAEKEYTVSVSVADPTDPLAANPRVYSINTGTTAPATATVLVGLLVDRVNLDSSAKVTASQTAGVFELVLNELDEGDFSTETSDDAPEVVNTAFVAPSGTPEIVEALAPTLSSPTAQYRTYDIVFKKASRSNVVKGAFVSNQVFTQYFVDEAAVNFAALDTQLDAVFAGTHTPVADYLGV